VTDDVFAFANSVSAKDVTESKKIVRTNLTLCQEFGDLTLCQEFGDELAYFAETYFAEKL
jgi:hypothetical protein